MLIACKARCHTSRPDRRATWPPINSFERMQNHQFYVMVSRIESAFSTEFLRIGDSSIGDIAKCEVCGQPVGPRAWLPPYNVELETWGNGFGDIAFTHVSQDILVTPTFRKAYDKSGLTGLSGFEAVQVAHVRKHKDFHGDIPLYQRGHILRGKPAIDPVASGVEWA
jgi:hypothetical protein